MKIEHLPYLDLLELLDRLRDGECFSIYGVYQVHRVSPFFCAQIITPFGHHISTSRKTAEEIIDELIRCKILN